MKKEEFLRILFPIVVLFLSLSVSAQNMKGAVKQAREAGMYGKVIDGKDAVDRAYERSRNKERIKELQRNGVSIENANSNKRAASSSSIGGAGKRKVRYNNSGSSYDGNYSSGTSNNSSSESNTPYAAEAQSHLNTWNEIDAKMQGRINAAENWKPSKSVNDMIANSRDGVKGNRDDGVEPDSDKPKGIKVNPLEGIIDDAKPEKKDSEYIERMKEYKRMFNEVQDSLSDEQLDELIDYLEKNNK